MGNQKVKKERLDVMLVEQGFFDSRENAKRHIMQVSSSSMMCLSIKRGQRSPWMQSCGSKGM